jgi:hypothetical protein
MHHVLAFGVIHSEGSRYENYETLCRSWWHLGERGYGPPDRAGLTTTVAGQVRPTPNISHLFG